MSFGEDSLKEFLLDHDVESVTVSDSHRLPTSHTISYKEMPNFGNSETGLTRPLLSVVLGHGVRGGGCQSYRLSPSPSPCAGSLQPAGGPSSD